MKQPQQQFHGEWQRIYRLDGGVTFSSQFDNGNLSSVERQGGTANPFDYRVTVAVDNVGTSYQAKHNAWFHFTVTGLPRGAVLRITVANASNHGPLYRQDMRPVYKSASTKGQWTRIRSSGAPPPSSFLWQCAQGPHRLLTPLPLCPLPRPTAVLFIRPDDGSPSPQIVFEHTVDAADDTLFLAFTYPYSYTDVQADMAVVDAAAAQAHAAVLAAPAVPDPEAIYCCRELLTRSPDGLRVDLVTIRCVSFPCC